MIYQMGDDGYYQMGYPIGGGQRFIDNGDGTVIDTATGLMWIKDPQAAGLGMTMYWYDAINACENLIYAGHDDWRMPNINELMSIVDHSRYNPAWDTMFLRIRQINGRRSGRRRFAHRGRMGRGVYIRMTGIRRLGVFLGICVTFGRFVAVNLNKRRL